MALAIELFVAFICGGTFTFILMCLFLSNPSDTEQKWYEKGWEDRDR